MSSFTIDHREIDALARKFANAQPIIGEEMVTGMTRVVTAIEGDAKRIVSVKTHNLQRSIAHQVQRGGGVIIGRVSTNVPYARLVEEGRGPIVAGPGKVLRFEIGGEVFYRKRVGPAKAKPYMKPALAKNRAAIVREFGTVVPHKIIVRLGLS